MSSCMYACMHGVGQYHAGDTGESLMSSAKSIENALLLFILDSGPMHYIGYSYIAYITCCVMLIITWATACTTCSYLANLCKMIRHILSTILTSIAIHSYMQEAWDYFYNMFDKTI